MLQHIPRSTEYEFESPTSKSAGISSDLDSGRDVDFFRFLYGYRPELFTFLEGLESPVLRHKIRIPAREKPRQKMAGSKILKEKSARDTNQPFGRSKIVQNMP